MKGKRMPEAMDRPKDFVKHIEQALFHGKHATPSHPQKPSKQGTVYTNEFFHVTHEGERFLLIHSRSGMLIYGHFKALEDAAHLARELVAHRDALKDPHEKHYYRWDFSSPKDATQILKTRAMLITHMVLAQYGYPQQGE